MSDGSQQRIQQPDELAQTLLERNQRHFAQADGTPFTRAPLCDSLTFSGVSNFGESILKGETIQDQISPSAKAILAKLQRVRPAQPHHIPFTAMISGLSKWRESTTTFPSNKHLGIYRSLVQYYKHATKQQSSTSKDATAGKIKPIAYTALKVKHLIINLAIQHTHTLKRWQKVHNFFIEKSPGNTTLEKLRVIHIYEADWNLVLK
jgi:hypothetical protein